MKVTRSWLREFAPDIDGDPTELGEILSSLGLAVEEMEVVGEVVDGVVLAKVLELRPHPDADKIQLVDVDRGDGQPLQVCCGAFNMQIGDLIPFATIGTVMPNGMEIAQRELRGQTSNGMCCSGAEIGMGDDHDGILILNERVADDAELGMSIGRALGIEADILWDLEVNANRPDAMSVAGVARDLAAALGVPFSYPDFSITTTGEQVDDLIKVTIEDPTLCGRFVATVLRDVTVGVSPAWMQNRLTQLGMRPINSVVDISNYVMLELGQPNHTFDLAAIPNGALRVRRARDGETLVTLDDVERALVPNDGVIANEADEIISLAGVMGGSTTEISDSTTDVLLEMAWWNPPSISRTVKRLNLPSEASTRFRRGADWGDNIDRAMRRFIQLAAESGVTAVEGFLDVHGETPDRTPLPVRIAKVNGLLGTGLSATDMAGHLTSIGFGVDIDGDDLSVTIPTWRWDTVTETDVAEEVGRMFGYANIERTVPKGEIAGGLTQYQKDRRLVRDVLVGVGCDETLPMPFLAPGDLFKAGLPEDGITLTNPLHAEESVLRTSLLPGQLKAIAYNQSHRTPDVRFFEIDHVFLPAPVGQLLPDEREYLAVALTGAEAPAAVEVLDVLDRALALPNVQLKPASPAGLHPTRSAEIMIAGRIRGHVGEVDPAVLEAYGVEGRVAWLELDLGTVLDGPHGTRKYTPVSKFPSSDIDLAFVADASVAASAIEGSLRKGGGALLVDLELFDVYRGPGVDEGSRSLTYRLRFQSIDRTLTDADVATVRESCLNQVAKKTGALLRE
ncbi:MAG: phenylalanine--tRNA ligase subunit beta [Acidimicrobiaceae bacterium]|jgi:phenylalanyl-tRNA synthetase beta chain|nr:phenylalanine--tRNA ligase subunit beta [Acidimicrobiaceae bacterium]MBT5850700.1 phenylalanine--tRNA ligase subunit beta [Acidimicrobiaceae bacterium]